jgi:hypothetical protein
MPPSSALFQAPEPVPPRAVALSRDPRCPLHACESLRGGPQGGALQGRRGRRGGLSGAAEARGEGGTRRACVAGQTGGPIELQILGRDQPWQASLSRGLPARRKPAGQTKRAAKLRLWVTALLRAKEAMMHHHYPRPS